MTDTLARDGTATAVSWAATEALITDRWDGLRAGRAAGTTRCYRVPSPTGGTFLVEVTLRPRWCSLAVDRWRTTDRDPSAGPWLRENVWPYVRRAHDTRGTGTGTLPGGGPTFTSASPVDRCDLLAVLTAWLDQELTWGTRPPSEP